MLTDQTVRNAKPDPTKRISLTDGAGLQLRISKAGVKSWSFQYRFNNSNKKLTLGTYPTINCTKARKLANDARYLIAQGIDPQYEKQKLRQQKLKFAEAWESFDKIHLSRNLKDKTAHEYRRLAKRYLLKKLGPVPLENIVRSDLVRLIDKVGENTPTTANRALSLLHKFFRWCVGRSHIEINPASGIPKVIKEKPRARILSLSEMRKIYKATDHLSKGNCLLVRLLLLTGQRVGVIARLLREEVKEDHLDVSGERNKSGSRIRIPLSDTARTCIEELSSADGSYIVSTTQGELPISGFSKLKAKLDKLTGVEDWRFHDIRRGLSTHLEDNGLDRFYVERVLTHKDKSVTGIYARSNHSHQLRVIFNKWAEVLTSKDGNTAENVLTFYREAQ